MFKKLLVILVLSFITSHSYSKDLYDLYKNSVSRKPYVEFLARSGVPGHAFVALGEELDNGLLFQKGVFGFYPKLDGAVSYIKMLFSVEGIIDLKMTDMNSDFTYRVFIDDEKLGKAEEVLKKWRGSQYSLFGSNCSKLASEVAVAVGLNLPINASPGSTLPYDYMKALKRTN